MIGTPRPASIVSDCSEGAMGNDVVEISNRQELAAEALDYRRQGYSYAAISECMNMPKGEILVLVTEAASALVFENPAHTKAIDIERIELMLTSVFQNAVGGDIGAINMALKLIERRRQLQGQGTIRQSPRSEPNLSELFEMPALADMFK